jgi:hypothetical protein
MRTCSVCAHPQLQEIDVLLASGSSIRSVSRLHGLARSTVARHRQHTHEIPRRLGVIRGQAGQSGPVDALGAAFELAKRAKTERERLKSLEAIRAATALLIRSQAGEPDAEALQLLNRNVNEAAEAFRSGSASFEQSIRALQGLREAIRQKLDSRRAPDAIQARLVVVRPGSDPEAEGTPMAMRPSDYWQGVPAKFHDPDEYTVERHVRLSFGVVSRGGPADIDIRVRNRAGALVFASERPTPAIGGDPT